MYIFVDCVFDLDIFLAWNLYAVFAEILDVELGFEGVVEGSFWLLDPEIWHGIEFGYFCSIVSNHALSVALLTDLQYSHLSV